MEEVMHKTVLSAAMALAAVGAGALTATDAGAAPLAGASLRPAIESLNPVDTVSCWRHGHYVRGRHCGNGPPEHNAAREYPPQEYGAARESSPPVRQRYFSRW
jgi:hypothetical protein